jgi:hypothetical protein
VSTVSCVRPSRLGSHRRPRQAHGPWPVPDIGLEAIEDEKKTCGIRKSGLIFTNGSGNPIGKSTLWMAWNAAATKVRPTRLRTICGTTSHRCTFAPAPIKALQVLLGPKNAAETWDTCGHQLHRPIQCSTPAASYRAYTPECEEP